MPLLPPSRLILPRVKIFSYILSRRGRRRLPPLLFRSKYSDWLKKSTLRRIGAGVLRRPSVDFILSSCYSSLYKYVRFYKAFPQILDAASTKSLSLTWTHYRELIRVTDDTARNWYMNEAIREGWSSRTLDRNIASQYYYRLLQSQAKEVVHDEMQALTADFQNDKLEFIKNPVVAEFLGLSPNSEFTETKLETSIITHIQKFVMELGKGYAFVARQQHIRTDMGDYFIDLVFYNYILKCFLLVDLKTSRITHQDVGQMDMYVRMYDQLKRTEGDNPTIGLILCSETSEDMARYSVMHDNERLFQAKYLTFLPTVEQLREEIELQKSVFRLQQGI